MDNTYKVIVAEFTTVDGVAGDPDGSWGEPGGGWALRQGPQVFAGDKFRLGPSMANGSLLFGRRTWQLFSQRWPQRTGDFPDAINGARKFVVSNTLTAVGEWSNSILLTGNLPAAVEDLRVTGDVVVIGSVPVAQQLASAHLVDEYRLLVLPSVVGRGRRLFTDGHDADLRLESADIVESGVLLRYHVLRAR